MAFVHFDSGYAPCGFLIVKDGGDPYVDVDTVLIQADWDYAGVASSMGWQACDCGDTDGTVPCEHKPNVADMLSSAYDHIRAHEGEAFETLDDYFI